MVAVGSEVGFNDPHNRMFVHVADPHPVETNSADMFPFIGPVPNRAGHFIAAGFAGHGKEVFISLFVHRTNSLRNAANPPFNSSHRT
jgi:hypothetical protein